MPTSSRASGRSCWLLPRRDPDRTGWRPLCRHKSRNSRPSGTGVSRVCRRNRVSAAARSGPTLMSDVRRAQAPRSPMSTRIPPPLQDRLACSTVNVQCTAEIPPHIPRSGAPEQTAAHRRTRPQLAIKRGRRASPTACGTSESRDANSPSLQDRPASRFGLGRRRWRRRHREARKRRGRPTSGLVGNETHGRQKRPPARADGRFDGAGLT
jgi:hypothetical protein